MSNTMASNEHFSSLTVRERERERERNHIHVSLFGEKGTTFLESINSIIFSRVIFESIFA